MRRLNFSADCRWLMENWVIIPMPSKWPAKRSVLANRTGVRVTPWPLALMHQGRFLGALDSLGFYRNPDELYLVRVQIEKMGGYDGQPASLARRRFAARRAARRFICIWPICMGRWLRMFRLAGTGRRLG